MATFDLKWLAAGLALGLCWLGRTEAVEETGSFDPNDPLVIVHDLVVTATPSGIELRFTAPAGMTISSYDVKTSTAVITSRDWDDGPGDFHGPFPHAGLPGMPQVIAVDDPFPAGLLHVAVRCNRGTGVAGYSNDATVTIAPNAPPATVINLAVTPGSETSSSLTLTWSLPAGFDADAEGIQIYYTTVPGGTPVTPAFVDGDSELYMTDVHDLSCTVLLPVAETSYTLAAKVRDSGGMVSTAFSNYASGSTLPGAAETSGEGGGDGGGCGGSSTAAGSGLALLLLAAVALRR